MRWFVFLLAAVLAMSSSAHAEDAPWVRHGPLGAGAGDHVIRHRDQTPFLWIGDTAWGMAQQLRREEVDRYLDDRAKAGFTVIQVVAYWYPHGGGLPSGPHNAANVYGSRPFAGGEDEPDTSRPLIIAGGDRMAPNDYWDNLDYIVSAAAKRNLYIALLPCWGRSYITAQFEGSRSVFTEEQAKAYGAFLGRRYAAAPNVLWMLGGDAKAQISGFDKRFVYRDYDKRSVIRAMAEGIGQGVTGKPLRWNQADSGWKDVFITYHPDGDPTDNSSKWFHNDPWLAANGVEIWREVDQVYPVMLSEYALRAPAKPSLFLEGSYEFGSYAHECGWVTPLKVRRQFYETFFAGGAGHTYGAGPIWAMRGSAGDYNCGYRWTDALAFPGARQLTAVGKPFMEAHEWSTWIPDASLVSSPPGENGSLKVAVRLDGGNSGLVYYADSGFARIHNTLRGSVELSWFDPRTGDTVEGGRLAADESRDLAPPRGWEDAILILSPLRA